MTIEANFNRIQDMIADAADRSGRDPSRVRVIGVTKTVGRVAVDEAYAAGLRDFGENRIQDALEKFEEPLPPAASLHLIGNLQTNKARQAVSLFQTVHSLDRKSVVDALQRRAEQADRTLDVLVQVNIAGEDQKHGSAPEDVEELLLFADSCENLRVIGLMTIAPLVSEPAEVRSVFQNLRELRDQLQEQHPSLHLAELSMGMTNDFVVAVEEGATMVRIGRALFEGTRL